MSTKTINNRYFVLEDTFDILSGQTTYITFEELLTANNITAGDSMYPIKVVYSAFSNNKNFKFYLLGGQMIGVTDRIEIVPVSSPTLPITVSGTPYSCGGYADNFPGETFKVGIENTNGTTLTITLFLKVFF
jgi:hypothetical protein